MAGDGIGPEIIAEALKVLDVLRHDGLKLETETALIGGAAFDTHGHPLPDETLEVVGASAVTVVDPADIAFTSIADAKPGETLTIVGARVHVLGAGSTYNLHTRRVAASVLYDSFVTGE